MWSTVLTSGDLCTTGSIIRLTENLCGCSGLVYQKMQLMVVNGQREHGNSMTGDVSYKRVIDNTQDIYSAQNKLKKLTAYKQHIPFPSLLWQLNIVNSTRAQSEETVISSAVNILRSLYIAKSPILTLPMRNKLSFPTSL